MKIYDMEDDYRYLCDRGGYRAGTQWELRLEMKMWNFIAKVVNFIINFKRKKYGYQTW